MLDYASKLQKMRLMTFLNFSFPHACIHNQQGSSYQLVVMPGSSVVNVHEDLFRSVAENGSLPDGRSWQDDVLPIFVQAVKDALDEAAEAFRENVKDAVASSSALVPPTTTTAFDHNEESFQSECSYLVEQLSLCVKGPPFTLQRLAEMLLNQDAMFRTARGGTLLRADVLQTAIRKCVLVSALE